MYPGGSLALSDAAQMDLYNKTTYDSPFGLADQEWLDRHGDVDDAGLDTASGRSCPASSTPRPRAVNKNGFFTIELWELNSWVAPSTSMGLNFGQPTAYPKLYNPTTGLSNGIDRMSRNVASLPALAHGSKRMNLNLPLPASDRARRAGPAEVRPRALPAVQERPRPARRRVA